MKAHIGVDSETAVWLVDGVRPDRWDVIGAAITLAGMTIIFFGPRSA